MAATVELFNFPIYHGSEMHIRINGFVGPGTLTVACGTESKSLTPKDGVAVVRFTGKDYGTHNVTVTLVDNGTTYTKTTSFSVPRPEAPEQQPYRFKDFWIAIGQPGAYTNAETYVNGLGETKPYYERVIGMNEDFKIKIKHVPYSLMSKSKNISVQSWKDEDGDDMWLPRVTADKPGEYNPQLTHEVVELEPTFIAYYTDNEKYNSNDQITALVKAIEGRWLRVWDEYTGIGYTGVVLVDVDDNPKFKRRNYDYAEFILKFKVNGVSIISRDFPFKDIQTN